MDVVFEISGDVATAFEEMERTDIYSRMTENVAEAIKKNILNEFEMSMRLMAYTGQHGGGDVINAITRSIHVKVSSLAPPTIEATFADDFSHWYEGGELPKELADILQGVFDDAINKWSSSQEAEDLISESLGL